MSVTLKQVVINVCDIIANKLSSANSRLTSLESYRTSHNNRISSLETWKTTANTDINNLKTKANSYPSYPSQLGSYGISFYGNNSITGSRGYLSFQEIYNVILNGISDGTLSRASTVFNISNFSDFPRLFQHIDGDFGPYTYNSSYVRLNISDYNNHGTVLPSYIPSNIKNQVQYTEWWSFNGVDEYGNITGYILKYGNDKYLYFFMDDNEGPIDAPFYGNEEPEEPIEEIVEPEEPIEEPIEEIVEEAPNEEPPIIEEVPEEIGEETIEEVPEPEPVEEPIEEVAEPVEEVAEEIVEEVAEEVPDEPI